jgi:PTH1 family peptidyl-tRNA hydrolase
MKVILGLGNPGKKFERTRHNVGFRAIEEFKEKNHFLDFKLSKRFLAEISEGFLNEEKIILAKPQTFMNASGQAVKKLASSFKLQVKNLWVIHDDIDLMLGKIRISAGRSSAGHKGVQSIINEIKTKDFVRFRIGIKPENNEQKTENRKQKIEKFVLQKFTKDEEKILKEVIEKTAKVIEMAVKEGTEKAMSEYNQ